MSVRRITESQWGKKILQGTYQTDSTMFNKFRKHGT